MKSKSARKRPRKKPSNTKVRTERFIITDFDALFGQGKDLWKDDAEFEEFLASIRRWRKEGLNRTRHD